MRLAFTLLLLTTAIAHGEPLDGWRGLRWGATKAEAMDLYRVDGAKENAAGVELPYSVGDDTFTAQLTFNDGGLMSVVLIPTIGDVRCGFKANDADIRSLLKLTQLGMRIDHMLEEKYGAPSRSSRDRSGVPNHSEWLLDGGNISFLMDYNGNPKDFRYVMRVVYSRKKAALDKL